MKPTARINGEDIGTLFSVVMYLNKDMEIIYASDTLLKCMPEVAKGKTLDAVFNPVRPAKLAEFSDGINSIGSLCLLTARDEKFAIRGQLIHSEVDGQECLCFYGAPWLFWIDSNAPDVELGLDDFSAQDVQLDQLFFMSTEKKMVSDLEQLNVDLQTAKEALEEAQEAQKQFFAQMSHEIRTPLNGVTSALALLNQLSLGEEQGEYIRLAQSSSENLMEVVNYVLGVSKLELAPSIDHVVFSWADLVRNTIDVVKARADEKNLAMYMDLADDLPSSCYGSRDRLRQTLLNLLVNAIKFTNEGSVTVRASVKSESGIHRVLRLEVSDTGIGIERGALKKIFQPFWTSTPEASKDRTEGTGLGLDISRRNVHAMGGKLLVDSTPGEGTTFWFELLVEVAPEDAQDPVAEAGEVDQSVALAGRVLLVDDNETNLILGGKLLESMGLEVIRALSGQEAIDTVEQDRPDLVLMDLTMPEMDGLEATRRIRKVHSALDLPIVALTAHIDEAEKTACEAAGMNDYLTKPIVPDEMRKVLSQWLEAVPESAAAETIPEEALPDVAEGVFLDHAVIDELTRQIGRDNLDEVVDKIRSESAVRWEELVQADADSDAEARARHVHSLKSISMSIGLHVLGDALAEAESQLRAGESMPKDWLEQLEGLRTDSMRALDLALDGSS